VNRFERRMAHEPAVAVEHRDLDFDRLAGDEFCRGFPGGARHFIAERQSCRFRLGEGFRGGVGGKDARAKCGRVPGGCTTTRD